MTAITSARAETRVAGGVVRARMAVLVLEEREQSGAVLVAVEDEPEFVPRRRYIPGWDD